MINYISSELYRTKNRLYGKMFIIISSICVILGSFAILYMQRFSNVPLHMDQGITALLNQFQTIYLFTMVAADIVYSEEYRHHTFKNSVSSGISRRSIYLGKFISEVIYAVISYVIIVVILFVSSYLILGSDHALTVESLRSLLYGTVAAFPLWVAGISIANLLLFVIKNNTIMAFAFAFIILGTKGILIILSLFFEPLEAVVSVLPSTLLKTIASGTALSSGFTLECYVVGIVLVALTTIAGIIIFERKEIK